MVTSLTTMDREELGHLVEEVKAILSQARELATMQMIAAKYMIGGAIITNKLYRKHSKNQSALYEAIGQEAEMRPSTLAECVKLYETYPGEKDANVIAEKLFLEHGAWRNVRASLYGGDVSATAETKSRCKNCPIHCVSVMNSKLKNKK